MLLATQGAEKTEPELSREKQEALDRLDRAYDRCKDAPKCPDTGRTICPDVREERRRAREAARRLGLPV